ncbi:phosphotransferase [Microbacterium sp. NPDC055312]
MARSPFTLVAAVTAAVPGAEVTGARALTADGDGRFDSAIATLADGSEVVIRVAADDAAAVELAEEALALRALTAGAREMLPFRVPTAMGETRVGEARALVTDLMPGFQVEAAHLPAGRGAAVSIGQAIAAVHALPPSVVRAAGLSVSDAAAVRAETGQLVDRASATGRVPARLSARWRDAVADDDLWRFESAVTLGGIQSLSFLFEDDPHDGPQVVAVLGWRGLSVGDPAEDLGWLSGAPDAAPDVLTAYTAASQRAADDALRARARLHAELEFARWLVHGDELRRPDIVDDAAALMESLSSGLRGDDLRVAATYTGGVDSALDVLDRVPATASSDIDTSMQTDAYRPEDLWHEAEPDEPGDAGDTARPGSPVPGEDPHAAAPTSPGHASWEEPTQDLTDIAGVRGSTRSADGVAAPGDAGRAADSDQPESADSDPDSDSDSDEAQRAARAALQRWTRSDSE